MDEDAGDAIAVAFEGQAGGGVMGVGRGGRSVARAAVGAAVSGAAITVADASGLFVGMAVTGTGVAANSTISSISGNTVTLSAATTGGAQVSRVTFGSKIGRAHV